LNGEPDNAQCEATLSVEEKETLGIYEEVCVL
jgi:hypothetical protein